MPIVCKKMKLLLRFFTEIAKSCGYYTTYKLYIEVSKSHLFFCCFKLIHKRIINNITLKSSVKLVPLEPNVHIWDHTPFFKKYIKTIKFILLYYLGHNYLENKKIKVIS